MSRLESDSADGCEVRALRHAVAEGEHVLGTRHIAVAFGGERLILSWATV